MAAVVFYTALTILILFIVASLLGIHLNKAEELKKQKQYADFLYRWNKLCQEESEKKEAENA